MIYIYIFIVIFDDLKFHDFVGDCNFQSGVIFIGCQTRPSFRRFLKKLDEATSFESLAAARARR